MVTRIAIVATVLLAQLLVAIDTSGRYQDSDASELMSSLKQICAPPGDSASTVPASEFPIPVPDSTRARMLASAPAEELPEGTEFLLGAGQLTIYGETEGKFRRSEGPLLFVVASGSVEIAVKGASRVYGIGGTVLVEPDTLYRIDNPTSEPATVLVAGILPPEGRTPINAFGSVAVWEPVVGEGELIARARFFGGGVVGLARDETMIFMACLTLADPAVGLATDGLPGPVGFLVLDGSAQVAGSEPLSAGDCWLVPAHTAFNLGAPNGAATVIVVGALRTSALPVPEPAQAPSAPASPGSPGCAGL